MVRGCQKKIIYLKNTDSKVFDEAYFVVSDKGTFEKIDECDMVKEANRILNECVSFSENDGNITRIKRFIKAKIPVLFIGIIIGILITLLII